MDRETSRDAQRTQTSRTSSIDKGSCFNTYARGSENLCARACVDCASKHVQSEKGEYKVVAFAYLPLYFGFLFSIKAATPSSKSSVEARTPKACASCINPFAKSVSMLLFINCLAS